ncbi:MAG: WYL domain-containing protein [Lachnospiraceae bacterium]|nr:WYL domain-containing protein [Lachnospiraceae bacterium]
MSRGSNQKFKFTYLMRIMLEKTDDEHALTLNQILEELEKYDVTAERKSIYTDFQDMTDKFGIEIIKEQIGRETYYHVGAREFELAEVKLLIDAIQSSKFITRAKSRDLINKVKSFVSDYQAGQLQRQIFINDRVKTMNESVYYNVDDIHAAINNNVKIRFMYYKWDIEKKLVPKHEDQWITVSPWALVWDDENYYMVAYDEADNKIKHYRVDKMMKIALTEEKRAGKDLFKNFDMAKYSKSTFGMYGGRECLVKFRIANSMCGVFIDRFGKDITFFPVDDEHSEFSVNVNVSPQFFGWIFGLGPEVKIVGPADVVKELKTYAVNFLDNM